MKATMWARTKMFVDRHATLIAFTLLLSVAAAAAAGIRWEAQQRDEQVEAEAVARAADLATEARERAEVVEAAAQERRAQICAESRNLRALVSALIDTAVSGDGDGGGLPLTTVPSFALLPESVQRWVHEFIAAGSTTPDGPSLAERLRTFQETRLGGLPDFCVP